MSIPVWMLLGFGAWTVILLATTVGTYRWSRILSGRDPIRVFDGDHREGAAWYRRAMRAHANCIENLPVFGAIVLVLYAGGIHGAVVDSLCIIVLAARIPHTLVHVCLVQTSGVAAVRFGLFFIQLLCFLALVALIVHHAVTGAG